MLQSVYTREGFYALDSDLRARLDNRRYEYLPSGLNELQAWARVTDALVTEVEAVFKAKAEAKAAEEARIAAAERSGHLVRKLEVTCDTRYHRGGVWVIRPDGSLRQHDGYGDGSSGRYTCYAWNMISDELVIVSEVNVVRGGLLTGGTGIIWRPSEVTQAQIATVEKIEAENGLGGTFEVDPGLVAKRAKMMEEIRKEILHVSPREQVQELRFLNVASKDGFQTREEQNPRRLANWGRPFSASCEGREAQVVKAVRCAGGMLEFLFYEKWGAGQLNVRWRALTEEENSTAKPAPAPIAETPQKLDLSKLFGGGAKVRENKKR